MVSLKASGYHFERLLKELKIEVFATLPNISRLDRESIAFSLRSRLTTQDKWYDLYLQQTLGRVLPDIIAAVTEAEPKDPIYEIAMALQSEARNQQYYKQQIAYLESLVEQDRLYKKEKQDQQNHMRFLQAQPQYLKTEYKKALAWQQDKYQRMLKQQRKMDVTKSQDLATKKSKEGREIKTQMKKIESEIKFEKDADKNKQTARKNSLSNVNRFKDMMQRLNAAHQKTAFNYLAPKLNVLNVFRKLHQDVQARRASQVVTAEPSKQNVDEEKEWSDGSEESFIFCKMYKDTDSDSDSSTFSSLPSLEGSPPPERHDRLQLKYERREARRMIQQALERGEFEKTKKGLKIRALKNWKKLGLKHTIKSDKGKGCNEHTLMPPVWAEEKFDSQVFYDPEIYTRPRTPTPPSTKHMTPESRGSPGISRSDSQHDYEKKRTRMSDTPDYTSDHDFEKGGKTWRESPVHISHHDLDERRFSKREKSPYKSHDNFQNRRMSKREKSPYKSNDDFHKRRMSKREESPYKSNDDFHKRRMSKGEISPYKSNDDFYKRRMSRREESPHTSKQDFHKRRIGKRENSPHTSKHDFHKRRIGKRESSPHTSKHDFHKRRFTKGETSPRTSNRYFEKRRKTSRKPSKQTSHHDYDKGRDSSEENQIKVPKVLSGRKYIQEEFKFPAIEPLDLGTIEESSTLDSSQKREIRKSNVEGFKTVDYSMKAIRKTLTEPKSLSMAGKSFSLAPKDQHPRLSIHKRYSTYQSHDSAKKHSVFPSHDATRKYSTQQGHGAKKKHSISQSRGTNKQHSISQSHAKHRKPSKFDSDDSHEKEDDQAKPSKFDSDDINEKDDDQTNSNIVDAYQEDGIYNNNYLIQADQQTKTQVGNPLQYSRNITCNRPLLTPIAHVVIRNNQSDCKKVQETD